MRRAPGDLATGYPPPVTDAPTPAEPSPTTSADLTHRFRSWLAWAVAGAAMLYVAFGIWAGIPEVASALGRFQWIWFVVGIVLTVVGNYLLRFLKWHWLLGRLDVKLPWGESALIFVAGLAMVISPAKAGEVLKPYLVRERTGVPMTRTIPALVTERLTDGIAALIIAAVSVSKFASDKTVYVYGVIGLVAVGIVILMNERASLAILHAMGRLKVLSRFTDKLEELYKAMRLCLAPWPLFVTMVISGIAWFAECWGYQLMWRGFDRDVSLEASSFLYAFATVAGGVSPGGLGVADTMLVGMPMTLLALPKDEVTAVSMLIRTATLWTGVLMGAIALLFVNRLLARPRRAA